MALKFVMFPESFIRLNAEVSNHPELMRRLQNHKAEDFEIRLAEIASYCSVVLDGIYDGPSQIKLCEILEKRLYSMRPTSIIIVS